MNLSQALRLSRTSRAALVGAGGKTTALFQAARTLDMPVVVTSSTHLGVWQAEFADRHLVVSRPEDLQSSSGQIEGVTLFSGPEEPDQRLGGLDDQTLFELYEMAGRLGFPILIEADGSRQKPLKAPGEHEPVIPDWVDTVIVTAGLSGLGQILDEKHVYRPDAFAAFSGRTVGDVIDENDLARVLIHPEGGLKGIPPGARKIALLNQVENEALYASGLRIANLVSPYFDSIILAALAEQTIHQVIEPTAGVVLAGGESSRFGKPKMLLDWRGKPLIRYAVEAALEAGLHPVIVVTGAVDEALREAVSDLEVVVQHNPLWQDGQSTSVAQGIRMLPQKTGAAVFLLADQPYVNKELIQALVQRHEETLAPIVAPKVGDRRANPVLFDRSTFPELLALQGDTGGRAIIDRYSIESVDWADANLLFDVDTPDDYHRLLGKA